MTDIKTAIRAMVKSMVKPDLMIGKVTAFDASAWTIDLELNIGAKVEDVTIKSVLNGEDSGIFIEPVDGSYVLCGMTDGKLENLTAMVYSEIKSIRFAPTEKLILRNEDFGGIVKSQKVHDEIKALKDEMNSLKTTLSTWAPMANDGGAALKALLSSFYTPLPPATKTDYENENVKHG